MITEHVMRIGVAARFEHVFNEIMKYECTLILHPYAEDSTRL